MAENTHFKNAYAREEVEACFEWFEQHRGELPAELTLSRSMHIPDLPACVDAFIHKLRPQMENKKIYAGQFAVLLMIKERLQQTIQATD